VGLVVLEVVLGVVLEVVLGVMEGLAGVELGVEVEEVAVEVAVEVEEAELAVVVEELAPTTGLLFADCGRRRETVLSATAAREDMVSRPAPLSTGSELVSFESHKGALCGQTDGDCSDIRLATGVLVLVVSAATVPQATEESTVAAAVATFGENGAPAEEASTARGDCLVSLGVTQGCAMWMATVGSQTERSSSSGWERDASA